jgi:hypothetical protein
MTPPLDRAWSDCCLGTPRAISWEPEHIIAAVAAATLALDGFDSAPTIEPKPYAPARQAEVDLALARAALAAKRDAGSIFDRAFASARSVSEDAKRDRALAWGAVELRVAGDARADAWAAEIGTRDYTPELAAYEVIRLAHAGKLSEATTALAALPPLWGVRTDVEYWHDYPRWLGSAAGAAAMALAAPIEARAAQCLVDAADALSLQITEDWRKNREYRALALAWGRAGNLERAFAAASRMPGIERARVIAELLDRFGDAMVTSVGRSGDALPAKVEHLAALAKASFAAPTGAPLVIGAVTDRAALSDFIAQATAGEIAAAIVRRHIARGDLAAADAAAAAIPSNLSAHHEAVLQAGCARLAVDARALEDVLAALPDAYGSNLAAAAAQVGNVDVMQAIVTREPFGDRIASNVAWPMIATGRLDTARVLLQGIHELAPGRAPALHGELLSAFARAGRPADAIAVLTAIPTLKSKTLEQTVLAAGHRAVVELVALGEGAAARELHELLAPRLARVGTTP